MTGMHFVSSLSIVCFYNLHVFTKCRITLKDLAQGVLREDQMAYVLHEVLVALNFLHSNNRMHRDVKGENVLICSDGSVKLGTNLHYIF